MRSAQAVKIVVGSGGTVFDGWISTDLETLDITSPLNWQRLFEPGCIDRILAEHVLEHLSERDCRTSLGECFCYLKPGGLLRIAVPDGFHPDPPYRECVRPGGTGDGASDHKVLYNYILLTEKLEGAGFNVQLLEYWDEKGMFHFHKWSSEDGHIFRSRLFDPRNRDGSLAYTSLIVDGIKPDPVDSYRH
jgi:predicted SAM-dependent methyltransferase